MPPPPPPPAGRLWAWPVHACGVAEAATCRRPAVGAAQHAPRQRTPQASTVSPPQSTPAGSEGSEVIGQPCDVLLPASPSDACRGNAPRAGAVGVGPVHVDDGAAAGQSAHPWVLEIGLADFDESHPASDRPQHIPHLVGDLVVVRVQAAGGVTARPVRVDANWLEGPAGRRLLSRRSAAYICSA